jgi:hypothetical protein
MPCEPFRLVRLLPLLLALLGTLAACSPAFDWRETHPENSGVSALFPCRPERRVREIELAAVRYRMEMLSCRAADTTFALGFLDVPDAPAVGAAIERLRSAAVANVGASVPQVAPFAIDGMSPELQAAHLSFAGRLPDGSAVHEEAVFFARGRRVYQAAVIGRAPPPEAVQTFIAGLKLPS